MKDLQGDVRKQAETAMVQVRAELKQQLATVGPAAAQQAAEEKARYEAAKSRPPDPGALSPDPRVSLKKALKSFLDETSGVDYAARDEDGVANAPLRRGPTTSRSRGRGRCATAPGAKPVTPRARSPRDGWQS